MARPKSARLNKETRFAVKSVGSGSALFGRGWRGEWAVPFSALGLKPEPGLKVGFNMAAYYSEFGEWRCWEGTDGHAGRGAG